MQEEFEKIVQGFEIKETLGEHFTPPEKKVIHKNQRLVRFEDVDMGEEVEAAIQNDGRVPRDSLKGYVNKQMDLFMKNKMN